MREDPQIRSRIMRAVKDKDTVPELIVRRMAHAMGYRFRLHRKDLPGKPDIVFPKFRKVIFVHGCFWHGHDCARGIRLPVENREYWRRKIKSNRERDSAIAHMLMEMGWEGMVLWECEIKDETGLRRQLSHFLHGLKN
ncbi:MAG: very short patch repair endonuclease [Bacillota bacterium]|jgi:DNA mismatch endonuclease (patch repair protein)|nr:very short patch repair endonuclease [Bacillota bacterium]